MHLVDQAGAQILPDRGDTATDPHVASSSSGLCLRQGGVNPFGDEMKLRPARHLEYLARVMRQHEHRRVIWRLVAPPAFPVLVRPRTPNRSEHVAPEDPGADAGKSLRRDAVVDAGFAA